MLCLPFKLECPWCRWKIVVGGQGCIIIAPLPLPDQCPRCKTRLRHAVPTLSEILNPVYRIRAKYWQLRGLGRLMFGTRVLR
jgi:hypothetical protein